MSEKFWEAVHDALDARRDPLAQAELVAGLCEHPDDLADVLRLDAGLRALAQPRRRRRWLLFFPASAAAALALVLWPRAPRVRRSEVFEYRLMVSTETPTTVVAATLDNGTLLRERTERVAESGGGLPIATWSMTTTQKGLR